MTSDTDVALGLASTPSSWTLPPAAPSSCRASTMLTVVSGHTVVHSESTNARMTTLPRNCCSDIRWPNWLSSVMPGAGCLPSELPGSRAGLAELGGTGGPGPVGLAAWDPAPPHPREPGRDRGQRVGRGRPEATAGLALGDPVADLDAAVAHPPMQADRPDQHAFLGGEHRV